MIWDNVSIFRTNCAILTSYICADHARVVGSRMDVVTLRNPMVRAVRFSCRFFTAMVENKAQKKNQGSSMYFHAPTLMEKVCFSGSRISFVSRCE